jgi:hypothetical protein
MLACDEPIAIGVRRISHHQRAQAYAAAARIVAKFEADDRELAARARDSRPDGYPTTSSAVDGGIRGGGHSDSTFRAGLARAEAPADVAEKALAKFFEAVDLLIVADSLRAKAFPPVTVTGDRADDCTNCLRHGVVSPRGRPKEVGHGSPLCGWCHAFQRAQGVLPPRDLVERHQRGERISERDVTAALGSPKTR